MKKILLALTIVGLSVTGLVVANAQYYDYSNMGTSYASMPYSTNYNYGTSPYGMSYPTMGTGYTNTGYSNYSYPQNNYYGGNSMYGNMMYGNNYGNNYSNNYGSSYGSYGTGGVGSYTIGCTTYYYNTRTGAALYTSNICNTNTYQYQQPTYQQSNCYYSCPRPYVNPYTYPTSYNNNNYGGSNYYGNTQYCTYRYTNGAWYPSCGY